MRFENFKQPSRRWKTFSRRKKWTASQRSGETKTIKPSVRLIGRISKIFLYPHGSTTKKQHLNPYLRIESNMQNLDVVNVRKKSRKLLNAILPPWTNKKKDRPRWYSQETPWSTKEKFELDLYYQRQVRTQGGFTFVVGEFRVRFGKVFPIRPLRMILPNSTNQWIKWMRSKSLASLTWAW